MTDACGTVDVMAVPMHRLPIQPAAKWTQTRTVTATDACGNDATCRVTYTWTVDVDDPEFAACPTASIDLDCNPAAITEAQAIADAGTVTDACGTVDVTAVADAPAAIQRAANGHKHGRLLQPTPVATMLPAR
ncbi:MAG: hypothetical protein IPK76_19675 [Lewinellaceae bacterium]|nr:hypothetical protein [Lewinellaceae bacterium]